MESPGPAAGTSGSPGHQPLNKSWRQVDGDRDIAAANRDSSPVQKIGDELIAVGEENPGEVEKPLEPLFELGRLPCGGGSHEGVEIRHQLWREPEAALHNPDGSDRPEEIALIERLLSHRGGKGKGKPEGSRGAITAQSGDEQLVGAVRGGSLSTFDHLSDPGEISDCDNSLPKSSHGEVRDPEGERADRRQVGWVSN